MSFKMQGRSEYFSINRNSLTIAAYDAMHAAGIRNTNKRPPDLSLVNTLIETIYQLGVHDGYEKGYRAGICDWAGYQEWEITPQFQSDLIDALHEFREGPAKDEIRKTEWLELMHCEFPGALNVSVMKNLSRQWKIPLNEVVLFCDAALELSQQQGASLRSQDETVKLIRDMVPGEARNWRDSTIHRRYLKVIELAEDAY